jgi:hypothetical protein
MNKAISVNVTNHIALAPDAVITACKVFEPELSIIGVDPDRVIYLEQGLHRYPDELRIELGKTLKRLERDTKINRVIPVYGYCGGGLEGLSSERLRITLPLCHDCIPLLLGRFPSPEHENGHATFYLSAGWIEHGKTPLTEFWESSERLGLEDARWAAREIVKHYRQVAVIENGAPLKPDYWTYALEMAELCGLKLTSAHGDLQWLKSLIQGRNHDYVITIPPGQTISKSMFLQWEK